MLFIVVNSNLNMRRFIIKNKQNLTPSNPLYIRTFTPVVKEEKKVEAPKASPKVEPVVVKEEIKQVEETDIMTTSEKVQLANQILGQEPKAKKVKTDKGLIERAESKKSIITEDNREILMD